MCVAKSVAVNEYKVTLIALFEGCPPQKAASKFLSCPMSVMKGCKLGGFKLLSEGKELHLLSVAARKGGAITTASERSLWADREDAGVGRAWHLHLTFLGMRREWLVQPTEVNICYRGRDYVAGVGNVFT